MQKKLSRVGRRLAAEQQGFALVLALGVTTVFAIATTSVAVYATTNSHDSTRSRGNQTALALAEAGLSMAYSTLEHASNPGMASALSATPVPDVPMVGGTATYYGTLDAATGVWTLTGIGKAPDANSPNRTAIRTVHGRARVGAASVSDQNNAVWNYVYADSLAGCTTIGGSVNVNVPLYIRGSLCLENQAQVSGYQLEVGGRVTFENQSHVGTSSSPVHDVHVAGGCSSNGATYGTCAPPWVYGTTVDTVTTRLTKPPVDLAGWYRNAMPGPMHPCTAGSTPFRFDNDGVMNDSLGSVNLVPTGQPYDCKVLDANGQLVGEIGWDGTTNLTVSGTVFVDGNLSFANLNNIVYHGRGTLYAAGTITLANQTHLCGSAGCDTSWDPTTNLLALVAGSVLNQSTSINITNYSVFQGAIYAVNDYAEGNNVTVWGPIIARQLYLQNSTTNFYVPIGVPLPGMPSTWDQVTTITPESGSWS